MKPNDEIASDFSTSTDAAEESAFVPAPYGFAAASGRTAGA